MHERLKQIRKNAKMTQQNFAEELGMMRSAYANYEIGRTIPSASFIKLVCYKFNVDENWLVNGTGEMYVETEDSILNQLKNTYNLSNLEYKILTAYLELDTSQRKAVEEFIHKITNPEPPASKDYNLVAARGNSELEIISDDEAVRKDIENYTPPTEI